eukprot:scaffold11930_cov168-Isochrysis_galbana.AAC.4
MRDFRMAALALTFTVAMELDMATTIKLDAGQGYGSKGEPPAFQCPKCVQTANCSRQTLLPAKA